MIIINCRSRRRTECSNSKHADKKQKTASWSFPRRLFFLGADRQLAVRVAVESILDVNTLKVRVVGLVLGLIHLAIQTAQSRSSEIVPRFGQVAGMDAGARFPVYNNLFNVPAEQGEVFLIIFQMI